MISNIAYHENNIGGDFLFSIIIPSWNNLPYLQNCIESIKQNSMYQHQIIILVNEGTDGSKDWVKSHDNFDYILSKENIGICFGLNACRTLVKTKYIVYLNDDMYVLPNWDMHLKQEMDKSQQPNFILSSTMIEPYSSNNPSVIYKDYGTDIENFKEKKLLLEFESLEKNDWSGSTWPPLLVPIHLWDLVGGMSIEFSPGMYSDPDLSMKLWQAGVREFKGIGRSKVYHFGKKSTGKIKQSKAKNVFLRKWKVTASYFYKKFLKMGSPYQGQLKDYKVKGFDRLKFRMRSFFGKN